MTNVHQISEARKARNEQGHVMHLCTKEASPNPGCPHCRNCEVCSEWACNNPSYVARAKEDGDDVHEWTSDIATWANHTNPCKGVYILRGPDVPATSADASGDTSPGPGGVS